MKKAHTLKLYRGITLFILLFIPFNLAAQQDPLLEKKFPAVFNVTHTITLKTNTLDLSKAFNPQFTIALALPPTNDYQEVSDLRVSSGEVLEYEGRKDKYLRFTGKEPFKEITYTYTLTTYKLFPQWDRVKKILPYSKTSTDYIRYTKRSEGRIQADNPRIQKAASDLRGQSKDFLDYARKAFIWEQKNLKWKSFYGSIDQIMANGGGECTSLSTILISLLRNNGIPARETTGYVLRDMKGDSHGWVEFYLEGYGWIPVDPSFTSSSLDNPVYFGHHDGRRVILLNGNDNQASDQKESFSIGPSLVAVRSKSGGGSISGAFDYGDKVEYGELDDGNKSESAYFNGPQTAKIIIEDTLQRVNKYRLKNGLPQFKLSQKLNDLASLYLETKEGEFLENSGLKYQNWARWSTWFDTPTLTPALTVNFNHDAFEKPPYNSLGIGYRYKSGMHNFYFICLGARDIIP